MSHSIAKLALEDGTIYTGQAFGAPGTTLGEVVFNTSLMGYQEILTDPSYRGQIVTMTYPLIGNYGTTAEDTESSGIQVSGFVVRELTKIPSNFRSHLDLHNYLARSKVIGIQGIDTRALVRRLRVRGAMAGILSTEELNDQRLIQRARSHGSMAGRDMVQEVVPPGPYSWNQGFGSLCEHFFPSSTTSRAPKNVVALDYGMKWNILRCLTEVGCNVSVLPGTASADEVLARNPDGIFLSNGPGDPAALDYAVNTLRGLIGKKPIFGICLGHQLLGRAFGAETFKLKFGHRGANQPVLNKQTGQVEITTQNHGFAVDPVSLPDSVEMTHVNLNDGTCEGLRHKELPIFCVQYHPEAAAGPHDSSYLFQQFREML
jgi:carbamoyl-phosphate synthase small subunit